MRVTIVVLNYNTKDSLIDCLGSLRNLKEDNHKIFVTVVDNASSDDSVKVVTKEFPQFGLIRNNRNLGFAGGNNVAIKKAMKDKADAVLLLNPDTKVDPDLVVEFAKAAKKYSNAGVFSSKIYFYPGFEFHKGRYKEEERGKVIWYAGGNIDWANVLASHRGVDEVDNGQYDIFEETDFATGAAMFVKKEVFDKVGLFNEDYFLYLEDLEFCQRAKNADFKILYVPKAVLWHKWAQAAKGGSSLQDYFITRNRLLFGLKYAPLRARIALLRQGVSFLFNGETKRKAVLDFFMGRLGEGSLQSIN